MRPKKRILFVTPSEDQSSIFKYVMQTTGYIVQVAHGSTEAVKAFDEAFYDMVIVSEFRAADKIVEELKKLAPYIPMVIMGDEKKITQTQHADAFLKSSIGVEEMIDRVKVWSARKRGPRKGVRSEVPRSVTCAGGKSNG